MEDVEIRNVSTRSEYDACVELQRRTWGDEFSEVVPASAMRIAVEMGGICLGAFDPGGDLLGLVFGMTGIRKGRLSHWSHMLGVRADARDRGVGTRLKLAQGKALRAAGVQTVHWTFDPLVARNAHLNLNRLGAGVDEYVPNMYGLSDGKLRGIETDRLVVRWDLRRGAAGRERAAEGRCGDALRRVRTDALSPVIGVPGGEDAWPPTADRVHVEIPRDIEAVASRSLEDAMRWRRSTRRALVRLLDDSWTISGFLAGPDRGRYVVRRRRQREPDGSDGGEKG